MGDSETADVAPERPMVEVCELGPLGIRHDGAWTSVRGERTSVLLASLSLKREEGVGSEQLIEAIWPSPDQPPTARQSLANMVSRLRRSFGDDVIESTRTGYRLGQEVSSDRHHFVSEIRTAVDLGDSDPVKALATVEEALGRWRGEPWIGLEHPIGVEADRAFLAELHMLGLRTQAAALTTLGRASEAVPILHSVLSANPSDEQTTELLATALGELGRRPEALQVIRATRRSLAQSGLVERPELAELERALLQPDTPEPPGTRTIPDLRIADLPERPGVLVGRDRLVDVIVGNILDRPVQLLLGRPGAGKSSIFAEVLHRLTSSANVLFGRGDDLTTEAFAAFRQALAPLRAARGDGVGALYGESSNGDGTREPPDRLAVFESVRAVLADAARLRPLVLGIDDAHWLDDGSALFLRNLALRPVPGLSLLVAARPEGERTPALVSRMLGDLRRLDGQATHDIGPLSPTAISELGQLLGRPLDDLEVARLVDSGGNALVVRELVVHSPDLIEVPDEVSSFFAQRLAELPGLARRVLSTAALLPEPIDVALLAEVVGEQADEVMSELARSVRADLLVGTPVDGLRFRHSLVRDAVAETIAEGDRSRVRADAAGVLRRTSVDSKVVAELLLSASSVPEPAEVVDACRRAGEVSAAELAHEDAARFFGQALTRLDPAADTAERLALTMCRAESLSAAWQWGEALPLFEAAADLARARGDAVVEADAVIRACGPPENYSWGDPIPAGLDRVLEHLGELDGDRAAVLLASKAIGEWDEGRVGEAQDLLRRARMLASSESAVSRVMRAHLRSWFDPVQVEERCRLADDLVELGVASSDLEIRAYGHRWAAITRFDAGDLELVEQHLDALAYVAERQRNLWHQWFVLTRRVTLETARGRLDAADAALTASSELARILETPYVRSSQASADFLVNWLGGRDVPDDVRAASDSSLFVRMALALTGDAIDTSMVRGALGILPARSLAGRSVAVLAAPLALAGEDPELARLTIEALSEYEDGVAVVAPGAAFLGSVRQRRGYCHLALDSPELALADFSSAAARERKIGAMGCAVRSEWLAGHALRVLGDHAAAAERQEGARIVAAGMGIRCLSDVPLPGSQLDPSSN